MMERASCYNEGMKISFPEMNNPIIAEAIKITKVEAVTVSSLAEGCKLVREGEVLGMIAGVEYDSREVILACKEYLEMEGETFSGAFVMKRRRVRGIVKDFEDDVETFIVADAAACKNPTADQLFDITCQSWEIARKVLDEEPRVAMLSFSTLGSGGKDVSFEKIRQVVERVRTDRPEILIDGEMQLDAAVNLEVAKRKFSGESAVAGRANVLVAPDLNSGNILYKSMEQFGGFTAAGPFLLGFRGLVSDLSRGSTVEDVVAVIEIMKEIN